MDDRKLSDEDVKAVVDMLESRLEQRFYVNLGKGLWATVWRGLIVIMCLVAAYGAAKGKWPF